MSYQRKNVKVTMDNVGLYIYIKGLHYPLTWFNGFCDGRGKKGALVNKKGPCYKNIVKKIL
jgi:hypothetical protein